MSEFANQHSDPIYFFVENVPRLRTLRWPNQRTEKMTFVYLTRLGLNLIVQLSDVVDADEGSIFQRQRLGEFGVARQRVGDALDGHAQVRLTFPLV